MKKLLIIFLFFSCIASAKITEKMKLSEIAPSADKETLLVFDIDSTVLEPTQMLGGDAWFYYTVDAGIKSGKIKQEAINAAMIPWLAAQEITEVRPVEKITAETIKRAQENGVMVMALTARPYELAEATLRQLNSIGVDFSKNPPIKKDIDFGNGFGRYYKGIFFASTTQNGNFIAHNKGSVLLRFLEKLGYTPQKIMFVDDRKNNVENVNTALAQKGLDCQCFRYGAADMQYKMFDSSIAKIQFDHLNKLLQDKEAGKLKELH